MKTINKKIDIDFSAGSQEIQFLGAVTTIQNPGDKAKKAPARFHIKLEGSGEVLSAVSWADILPTLRESADNLLVYNFIGSASMYQDQEQIRISQIEPTFKESSQKKMTETLDIDSTRREISTLVSTYISSPLLRSLLDYFILQNEDYFKFPAATAVHHNYLGGLAKHSLGVAKAVLSDCENYRGEFINKEILVAGALLHDIGKLREYTSTGGRTNFGDFHPHITIGVRMLTEFGISIGIGMGKNNEFEQIIHIIESHHGKLEFGSPVEPVTLEAFLISEADNRDSKIEAITTSLRDTNAGTFSDRIIAINNKKMFRF